LSVGEEFKCRSGSGGRMPLSLRVVEKGGRRRAKPKKGAMVVDQEDAGGDPQKKGAAGRNRKPGRREKFT